MSKRIASGTILALLLVGTLTLAFNIQSGKSDYVWTETIYIRADGSIEPPGAPVSTVDHLTYMLTDNIVGPIPDHTSAIIIERNYTVLDGAGYKLNGLGNPQGGSTGIYVGGRSNVTIKNAEIRGFFYGVWLFSSLNSNVAGNSITANGYCGILLNSSSKYNSISGNSITANSNGIMLGSSSNNSVSGNSIAANNYEGIVLLSSSNNSVSGNSIAANSHGIVLSSSCNYNSFSGNNITANSYYGIVLSYYSKYNSFNGNNITATRYGIWVDYYSNYNIISRNNITNNYYGIRLDSFSSDNKFCHNNFIDNTYQAYSSGEQNIWDDGYPSGGNYWSDYTGVDSFSGPYQNETGSDGIGDTPYPIQADNVDRYPLMNLQVSILGDVDDNGIVNMLDMYIIVLHYAAQVGEPNYIFNCDLDSNGIINMLDLYIAALHFGQTDP